MTSEMQRSYCKRGQIALCISPMARQNGPAKYMDSMRQQQPWCNSVCVCVCNTWFKRVDASVSMQECPR